MSSSEKFGEMVGGCCVCGDERGWDENPLVYCDGQGCTVAVHQACYGIVSVPPGEWFCRKCESQERPSTKKCDLCPIRDGALKRTDQGGWAHVVCALYIPEVRFGNVTTMEPILISLIPAERFGRPCSICEINNRGSKATAGACMQCNKPGCKQTFHVTCAQMQGLLCEEAGNMDNVKYCGYCLHHYGKLKTSRNMKIIPPFRPVHNANADSPTSSPEKNGSKSTNEDGKATSSSSSSLPKISSSSADYISSSRKSSTSVSPDIDSASKNSKSSSKKGSNHSSSKGATSDGSASGKSSSGGTITPKIAQPVLNPATFSTNKTTSSNNGSDVMEVEEKKDSSSGGGSKSKSGKGGDHESSSKNDDSLTIKLERVDNPLLKGSSSHPKKDFTTLQLKEVVTAALDRPMTTGSKYDNVSSSLTGGIEPPISSIGSNSSTGSHSSRHSHHGGGGEKALAPPDIKPHVTLTPIPMRGSSTRLNLSRGDGDEEKEKDTAAPVSSSKHKSSSNSSLSFHNSFGPPKLQNQSITSPDDAESSTKSAKHSDSNNDLPLLEKSVPPAKRSRGASKDDERDRKTPTKQRGGRRGTSNAGYSKRDNSNSSFVDENSHDDPMDGSSSAASNRGGRSGPGRKPITSRYTGRPAEEPPAPTLSQLSQMKNQAESSSVSLNPTTTENTISVLPTHMFGNALNPASSMAQRLVDTLGQEMEAVVAAGASGMPDISSPPTPLVGIPMPGKSSSNGQAINGNSGSSTVNSASGAPQTLEQLLERQWEQGSQFLMEQAQHLDIAQLLSCLNQLKQDNRALEEHVQSLVQRRDQLIAINARLSVPLGSSNALSSLGPGISNQHNGPNQNGHGTPPPNNHTGQNLSSVPPKVLHVTSAAPSPQQQHELIMQSGGRHGHGRDERMFSHSEMHASRAEIVAHPTASPHNHGGHQQSHGGRSNVAPYGYPGNHSGPPVHTLGVNSHQQSPHSSAHHHHHPHSRDSSR